MPNDVASVAAKTGIEPIYLGRWKGNYIYTACDHDMKHTIFFMIDSHANKIKEVKISDKEFYGYTFPNPAEMFKLRNNSIYILSKVKFNAVVSEIKLEDLFH